MLSSSHLQHQLFTGDVTAMLSSSHQQHQLFTGDVIRQPDISQDIVFSHYPTIMWVPILLMFPDRGPRVKKEYLRKPLSDQGRECGLGGKGGKVCNIYIIYKRSRVSFILQSNVRYGISSNVGGKIKIISYSKLFSYMDHWSTGSLVELWKDGCRKFWSYRYRTVLNSNYRRSQMFRSWVIRFPWPWLLTLCFDL